MMIPARIAGSPPSCRRGGRWKGRARAVKRGFLLQAFENGLAG
jgi:hypothetical protein